MEKGLDSALSLPENDCQALLILRLDDQRYALFLDAVERVVRAVAVTPVPEVPAFVLGLINVAGQLLPVVSLRACLGLPDRPVRPQDQFVFARTPLLTVALVVDEVQELSALDIGRAVAPAEVLPQGDWRVQSLIKINGDIILIYDLDKLISHADQSQMLEVKVKAGKCGQAE